MFQKVGRTVFQKIETKQVENERLESGKHCLKKLLRIRLRLELMKLGLSLIK